MIDIQRAKNIATQKLAELQKIVGQDLSFIEIEPEEIDDGWLFYYNTKIAIETDDPLEGLAGNGPIHVTGSGEVNLESSTNSPLK